MRVLISTPPLGTARIPTISNIRFIAIFAMTFAHVSVNWDAGGPTSTFNFDPSVSPFLLIIHDGLTRVSSPLLGFFSAHFALGALEHRGYLSVVGSRVRTLLVPTIVWSAVYVAVRLAPGIVTSDKDYIASILQSVDVDSFLGFVDRPANGPLHYLVNLFELIVVLPLLLFLLDRAGKAVYLALVVIVFIATSQYTPGEVPGMNASTPVPRSDLFLFFSLGVLTRRRYGPDVIANLLKFSLRNPASIVLCALVLMAGALWWRQFVEMDTELSSWLGLIFLMATRVAGCLLIVTAIPWIARLAHRGYVANDRFTFLLFCTHIITYFAVEYAINLVVGWSPSEALQIAASLFLPFCAVLVALVLFWAATMIRTARASVPF